MKREKTLFLLMSHEMTTTQIDDARKNWSIGHIVKVPSEHWGQIPADAASVCPSLEEVFAFLRQEAYPGDLLLVQGDFGATVAMVSFARRLGIEPIYATTRRVAHEKVQGERIVTVRTFEHVRFRAYEFECEKS